MDIINPVIERPVISGMTTLALWVNSLVDIPRIKIGELKRLAVNNPTASKATLIVQDVYALDSSNGNPTPGPAAAVNRYTLVVPAGEWMDLNGHTISKHMGTLQINTDVANVVASYVLELN